MGTPEAEVAGEVVKGAVSAVVEPFARLIDNTLGGASKQIGLMIEDKLKFVRTKNLIAISALYDQLVPPGTQTRPVSTQVLVPAIQAASLADDEKLRDMWARLLASAATTGRVQHYFVAHLAALSRIDADVLEFLRMKRDAVRESNKEDILGRFEWTHFGSQEAREEVFTFLRLPDDEEGNHALGLSLEHVCALGLVQPIQDGEAVMFVHYALTIQGSALLEACRPLSS